MGEINDVELEIRGDERITSPSSENTKVTDPPPSPPASSKLKQYILISTYTVFILAGQTIATLLGQFYYNKGGSSAWLSAAVTSGCVPILLPTYFFISSYKPSNSPPLKKLLLPYILIGVASSIDNLMYSYGQLYLPVSTFSLVCATQLGFNAVFSFFLNSQRLTSPVLNSVVLVTFSAALLGVSPDRSDADAGEEAPSRSNRPLGFVLTLAASAVFSFLMSVTELMYQKVLRTRGFFVVFEMVVWTGSVASVGSVVGLFASGEWRGLGKEMAGFETGKVSYVMTLIWIGVGWQVYGVGVLGLTFVVSSLFSNMISTVGLPLVPVFAVVFFREEMDGVKVLALLLALWGFVSYLYQDYIDYYHDKPKNEEEKRDDVSSHTVAMLRQPKDANGVCQQTLQCTRDCVKSH